MTVYIQGFSKFIPHLVIFIKVHFYETFICILLIISLLIRIANFNFQDLQYNLDGYRDYLVANHIIIYHEFPSTGPYNHYKPELKNSPTYFYLLAGFLIIQNDVLFLALVNIFLGLLTILLIYLLAKLMFSKSTGLLAAILFSFSQISIHQSIFYIWQPWVMQVFTLLGLLLLLYSYQKKNYPLLLSSIVIFIFSCSLYYSAFSLLPIFMLLVFYILKKQKKNNLYYVGVIETSLISILIFYLPTLIYLIDEKVAILPLVPAKGLIPLKNFLPEFLSLSALFTDSYLFNFGRSIFSINNLIILIVLVSFSYIINSSKDATKKAYYLILLFSILIPLVFVTLFQLNRPPQPQTTPPIYGLIHYFTISYPLLTILIADIIGSVFPKNPIIIAPKLLIAITIISLSSPFLYRYLDNLPNKLFTKRQTQVPAVDAIRNEVVKMKYEEDLKNINFFQIRYYLRGRDIPIIDNSTFWVILEKDLNTKLTRISDISTENFEPIGSDQIIFVVCNDYLNEIEEKNLCTDIFLKQNTIYSLTEKIYSTFPYSVYIAKRNN